MDNAPTDVMTVTFPVTTNEQALLSSNKLAAKLQQTHQNLAGQLAPRSQRIYQTDVAAFLWWLRAHRAGERPGRYAAHGQDEALSSPAADAVLLAGLTRDEVIAYRAYLEAYDLADPEGQRRLYAKTTAVRRLTVLRRLCAEAVFKGLFAENPTEGVRGVRGAAPDETPHQALSIEQLHQLLDAIGTETRKDLRDKTLLTILSRLGLRREEASQLNWSDLEERDGHLVFRIRHGKGDQAGVAKVPVDVARQLEEYRAALGEVTQPIFVVLRKGSHLRRDAAGRVIRLDGKGIERVTAERARQAKLKLAKPLTPHDLRATFITLALEGKAPLQTVQYAARHKDPRTTEHYQRRRVNLDDNAVDYIHY